MAKRETAYDTLYCTAQVEASETSLEGIKMIEVRSHSLGVDFQNELGHTERIIRIKRFKKAGFRCSLYIVLQKLLEDYVEIDMIQDDQEVTK